MGKIFEMQLDDRLGHFVQNLAASNDYKDEQDVIEQGLELLMIEEENKDVPLKLTPLSCLGIALYDTGISGVNFLYDDPNNSRFHSTYLILEKRMNDAGYITDENGETHYNEDSEKPSSIFARTIRGFFPTAQEDQLSAAWELFIYHMKRQKNT